MRRFYRLAHKRGSAIGARARLRLEWPHLVYLPRVAESKMNIFLQVPVFLSVACAPHLAGAADLYDTINALRAGQGGCAVAQPMAPLTRRPALELTAQALSRGVALPEGLKDSAYRASASLFISMAGDGVIGKAGALLGKQYCKQVLNADATEIGIYQEARQFWIVIAAPFAPQVSLQADAAGQRVLELVNAARAQARNCGNKAFKAVKPVKWSAPLAEISARHAADMAQNNYFSHTGLDGSTPAARVTRAGYKFRATGENIAGGQTSPEDAVAGWIKSPPHCGNLMNGAYTEMGVAFAVNRTSEMGVYWAQTFGTPR